MTKTHSTSSGVAPLDYSWYWRDFLGTILILLLRVATIGTTDYDKWRFPSLPRWAKAPFRVYVERFWNKKSFFCSTVVCFVIIQNRFHVAVRLFSNRSQKTSKCGKNISDTLGYRLVCHVFVLTTFWRHLWSITRQKHGNMESIC